MEGIHYIKKKKKKRSVSYPEALRLRYIGIHPTFYNHF